MPVLLSKKYKSFFIKRWWLALRARFSHEKELYERLNNLLGEYPNKLFLYKVAFTHRSVVVSTGNYSNERLEFLGDSVLNTIVSTYLFSVFPNKNEGFLTLMRARIVSRSSLGNIAQKMDLGSFLVSQPFVQTQGKYIYGNAVEALIGAVYLDKGYEVAARFVKTRLLEPYINLEQLATQEIDFKSRVLEWCQKNKQKAVFELLPSVNTAANRHLFNVCLYMDGEVAGQGSGSTKKEAEQLAARQAWELYLTPGVHSSAS